MEKVTSSVCIDGFDLGYVTEGVGPSALVIGSAVQYPRHFSSDLRRHLRMTFIDHRGYAPVPAGVLPDSIDLGTIVDDVEVMRQELDLGEVVVIGHSGNALIALEYAKRYPDRVTHLVMIGIGPNLGTEAREQTERSWKESVDPERKRVMEESRKRFPTDEMRRLPASELIVKSMQRNGPRTWFDPKFDSSALWKGSKPNEIFSKIWSQDLAQLDIRDGLSDLELPVFLALGRYDFVVSPSGSWNPFRPIFQDLTIRVFERSAHCPHLEQADLFDQELLLWLESRT